MNFDRDIRVLIGIDPIDFRAGINKVRTIAHEVFDEDPMGGDVLFMFKNKRRTDVKFLLYDGTGFILGHKRLSEGKLRWWPRNEYEAQAISSERVIRLLHGVDPRSEYHPEWQEVLERLEQRRRGKSINPESGRASGAAGTFS